MLLITSVIIDFLQGVCRRDYLVGNGWNGSGTIGNGEGRDGERRGSVSIVTVLSNNRWSVGSNVGSLIAAPIFGDLLRCSLSVDRFAIKQQNTAGSHRKKTKDSADS